MSIADRGKLPGHNVLVSQSGRGGVQRSASTSNRRRTPCRFMDRGGGLLLQLWSSHRSFASRRRIDHLLSQSCDKARCPAAKSTNTISWRSGFALGDDLVLQDVHAAFRLFLVEEWFSSDRSPTDRDLLSNRNSQFVSFRVLVGQLQKTFATHRFVRHMIDYATSGSVCRTRLVGFSPASVPANA